MENDRVDKLACVFLTQAAKSLEANKGSDTNYRLIKADGDKWSLTYVFNTPYGNLIGYYNPLPAVKMMINDTFDVSPDCVPEDARANFEALFISVLRLIHNFPTVMRLALEKHALLSLAQPHYDYEESLSDRLRTAGADVPTRTFKDVLDSSPALKKISDVERRLAGVRRPGNPYKKRKRVQPSQQPPTPQQSSLADFGIGIFGLPRLSEYEREQHDMWRKVFWVVYNAKTRGVGNEYLHQEYLADEILGLHADEDASSESAARRLRRILKKYELKYSEIKREAIQAATAKKKSKMRPKTDI